MNVIGEDIVLITQGLRSLLQPLNRQTVSSINSRRTQNTDHHPVPPPEDSQLTLGINAA